MFRNTLTGLSKREKEVFDAVCVHLNGCMRRMGLKTLDGEEDQILMDLWLDSFPYKTDENGDYVMRTIREKVWATVDGKYVQVVKEKQVRERDFSRSLMESTSVGIYKWHGEQLFLNKVKYLYGDCRVRKMTEEGKAATRVEVDSWGNERVRAVYEGEVDPKKVSKRDMSLTVNESDLARDGEDPITIADVAGVDDGGYEEIVLMNSIAAVCDETEMCVVRKWLDGDSTNRIYKDFDAAGVKFSARQMEKLKAKVGAILRPALV